MEAFLQYLQPIIELLTWLWSHSAFVGALVFGMILGQFVKTTIFTEAKAKAKGKYQWFWWWGWKSLAIQPALFGWFAGYFMPEPEPGITGRHINLYFAQAGIHSVWTYQVLKGLAKKKGIEIRLPGESDPPSK